MRGPTGGCGFAAMTAPRDVRVAWLGYASMRVARTLSRSIAAELLAFAGIGFFGFVAILLVQNVAVRLGELVAVGITFTDTRAVLGCLFGMVAPYAVPVGFLFGTLAVIGRLSADAEVTAMRS